MEPRFCWLSSEEIRAYRNQESRRTHRSAEGKMRDGPWQGESYGKK